MFVFVLFSLVVWFFWGSFVVVGVVVVFSFFVFVFCFVVVCLCSSSSSIVLVVASETIKIWIERFNDCGKGRNQ